MSFLKKLFGGGGDSGSGDPAVMEEYEHKGFNIATSPIKEGGQFRVCALITREIDGELKTHKLIRADMCSTADEASQIAMRKAKQMIDEQGDRLFN